MNAVATRRLIPRPWRRLPLRSARLRLTLLYSGLFLLLGTAIVAVIFAVVWSGAAIDVSGSRAVSAAPSQAGSIVHTVVTQQHSADVARVLAVSWFTLVLAAFASAVLGWFAAGRVLRPLRQMTAGARAITAGNLHQRLALAGPDDEFKQLGDTVDDLLSRLEGSFAAQRRFVANAAHELRTPLTAMRTAIEVTLAKPERTPEQVEAMALRVAQSVQRAEATIEALLTLATSEAGLTAQEPIDLATAAEDALDAAHAAIAQRRITVEAALEPALARGDRVLLERMIANLVENAVRHNSPDGWVGIRTGQRGERATFEVANTGAPVAAEEIPVLFEPFARAHQRVNSHDGVGLGLSIATAIARAHDATITARPRPGGGLEMTVSVPGR